MPGDPPKEMLFFFMVEVGFQTSPGPTQCEKGGDLIPNHPHHYAPLASVDASAVLRRRGLIGKRS